MEYEALSCTATDPYHNLAVEELLFAEVRPGKAILFFWQNEDTIVVGRNQEVLSECRMKEFQEQGGKIARRRSGGGAVYHDLGNLNVSLLCREEEKSFCSLQELVAEALRMFELKIEYNGRNDLSVNGRKFSGMAACRADGVFCIHGTILIDCNLERMDWFLTPDTEKLRRNRVRSVRGRVINLSLLDPAVTVSSVKKALMSVSNAKEAIRMPERSRIRDLSEIYGSREWIMEGVR